MKALVATISLLACGTALLARQDRVLDKIIEAPLPIDLAGVEVSGLVQSRFGIIGRVTGAITGFEAATAPFQGSTTERHTDVRGMTVRDALNMLVTSDIRYEWRHIGGVIVMRPKLAWKDCAHFLNREVSFDQDLNATSAIAAVMHLIDPKYPQRALPTSGLSTTLFTVDLPSGQVLDVLNAIATRGESSWRILYGQNSGDRQWIELSLDTKDGHRAGWGAMLHPMPATCKQ